MFNYNKTFMSALSKLLPKNNKAYVVTTSFAKKKEPAKSLIVQTTSPEKPKRGRKPKTVSGQSQPSPTKTPRKKKANLSKEEMRKVKQIEAENRAANEYYAKQNRRKHAIISNYVKKAEEEKQLQKLPPPPATTKPSNPDNPINITKPTKIISFAKYLESKHPESVQKNKRPVAINRIINNYRLIVDPDNIDKALDKLRLKKQFESVKVEPGDSTSMIKAKIKLADENRSKDIERRLLKQRT